MPHGTNHRPHPPAGSSDPAWSPHGTRIAYASDRDSGHLNIWTMNADGTNQKQLTDKQGSNYQPSMTADGRYIVFGSNRVGRIEHIFRIDADGRNQKQLTNGLREWSPRLSPDGKWLYYVAATPGDAPVNICKIPIDGGECVVIANTQGYSQIDVSPRDGSVAYEYRGEAEEQGQRKIFIISPDGGTPTKTLTIPPTALNRLFHWTPDGRAIAFNDARNGGANLWTISLDGKGEAKPLTDFKTESIFSFAWSGDGKQLAIIRGTSVSDAVLISEAK